jgi:hypothetical protein
MTGRTPSPVTAAAGGNGFSAARGPGGVADAPRTLLEGGLPGQGKIPRWVITALAVVAVAVIAVVLVLVLSSGSSHRKTAAARHPTTANIAPAPSDVVPRLVTVAVVNGTNVNQLAHHVADRLTGQNFKGGTLATATNLSLAATTVGYLPGHRNDALAVAHVLRLPASAVHPASQSSEGLVCPTATSCPDDVIVVAGSNLAPKG